MKVMRLEESGGKYQVVMATGGGEGLGGEFVNQRREGRREEVQW